MDPISVVVVCLAIWGILQRTPSLVGSLVNETRHAARGEESPAAAERKQRLIGAGIDPSAGGPMRQFFANWWRDAWLDMDQKRQEKASERRARGEESKWRDRVDDEFGGRTDQWRPDPEPTGGGYEPSGGSGAAGEGGPDCPDDSGSDQRADADSGGFDDDHSGERDDDQPDAEPSGWGETDDREPIRVDATTGEPNRPHQPPPDSQETYALPASPWGGATAVLEGEPMSTVATNGTAVTGVLSGAAEAAAIHRQIEAATQAYVAELIRVRGRINSLGEQTLAIVQFAGASTVVQRMAQAAEAAAAAQSAAANCAREVGPLLLATKREFDKRNS